MISSIKPPKNKSELVQSINRLPTNVKFDVIEVSSSTDKPSVIKVIDQYVRKGGFSVVFIERSRDTHK